MLTQLLLVCSEETSERCKATLKRHNFNLEAAANELLAPPEHFPSLSEMQPLNPNPETASLSSIEDDLQVTGTRLPPPPPPEPAPASAQNNSSSPNLNRPARHFNPNIAHNSPTLRHRFNQNNRRPVNNPRTFAQAVRQQNHQQNSFLNRLPNSIRRIITALISVLNLPFSVFMNLLNTFLPVSSANFLTNNLRPKTSRSNLPPLEEVKNSVKLVKNSAHLAENFRNLDFLKLTYNQALSKTKSEVKYLLVYLHVVEHQNTTNFVNTLAPEIEKFVEENEALIWTCQLDSREGAATANELFITEYPCLALLAPVSSARVSCITQITKDSDFGEILKAKDNFAGELVGRGWENFEFSSF